MPARARRASCGSKARTTSSRTVMSSKSGTGSLSPNFPLTSGVHLRLFSCRSISGGAGHMWSDLKYRIRALFRATALDRELDDELQLHLERQIEKSMNAGLSREEAERRSRIALGGVEYTKEDCRQARGVALVESLKQDLVYAT